MMSGPPDSGEWKTPRLSDKRLVLQSTEAVGPIDVEGKVMLPAAVVYPFTTGDGQGKSDDDGNTFLHRPHLRYHNLPSPYILSTQASTSPSVSPLPFQACSPSTPVTGLVRSSPKSLTYEQVRKFSTNSQDMELQSLRCQVQEIQNRLNGDITASPEYRQLLEEKLSLEHTLGATEHELQELKIAFSNLETTAARAEEKMARKINDAMEKQQILVEKYNTTSQESKRLKEYLQNIPTQAEHFQLQQQVSKKSIQMTHLSEKVELLSSQMAQLKERETRFKREVDVLSQEKEDLSMKLRLTENILTDIESQKALAVEQGEDTKEDLLWHLDRHEKELSSAKKLLNYRKTKIESLNKDLIEQERKYNEKIQEEVESGEKLKETIWELQRELEVYKMNENKMKTTIKTSDEKIKKLEENLQVSLMQIKSHHEMNSTINSLFSNLHKAVFTLRDLVKISTQISKGITPDLSVLLSITESDERLGGGAISLENLKNRLTEVRELIQQLESIRSSLQDQHADQIAANTTCAQM